MKIVYFNYLYDVDNLAVGSAVHVNEFEREFKKLGVQIDTFYLNVNHNCNDSKDAAKNILKRKFSKAFNHINAFMKNGNQLIKENRILEEKRPDLILTRYNLLNFSSALLAKIKKIPIVLEVNSPQAYESKNFYRHSYHWPFLSELIEKINLKIADAVIVVSEELKNYFVKRKVAPQKIFVIPNGVDPEKFYPFGKTKSIIDKYKLKDFVVIGFVGSFHYWHGIDNLIDLIKRVLSKYDNVCFLLIGKGALNDEIEQVINEHIKSKVILLGYVSHKDVPKYLSIIDIAIAPYPKMEFFYFSPLKIFEYMASGKAVVSSKIGQIGRIIKDGENGLLFEPDNKEELFSKVSQLIENEEMRKKLGGQARASVINNYTWKVNAKSIFDICNSCLNNGKQHK